MTALEWIAVAASAGATIAAGMTLYWAIQARREHRKLRAIYEARRREEFETTWRRLWRS